MRGTMCVISDAVFSRHLRIPSMELSAFPEHPALARIEASNVLRPPTTQVYAHARATRRERQGSGRVFPQKSQCPEEI